MKLGLRSGSLSLALMLGIAGVGCGDDDGMVEVDSGTPTDAGMRDTGTGDPDTGVMEDAGVDAGPPVESAYVRLAHLSPDTGRVQACIDLTFSGTRVGGPGPLPADGIPFRGISPYLQLDITEGATYVVRLFVMEEGVTIDCSLTEEMAGFVPASLTLSVDSSDLDADARYTGAAVGYTSEQSNCLPDFMTACGEAQDARIELYPDDAILDPAAAKIRVIHAIPNAPAVDVCYDDDPEDETPPVAIASNVAFAEASEFFSSDAAIASGVLSVHVHVPGMSCVNSEATTLAQMPLPDTFAAIRMNPAFMSILPFLPESFALNNVYTIFAQGIAPMPVAMDNPAGVLFLPWQDAPAPMTM
ncbi:MAG: DUF4397 domain-containing protein [Sandaracinus sp.]|nr:DUF4397 domain-containing protein [Sandaracinus sp.]